MLITRGSDLIVENLELTAMDVSDDNGAGIRHEGTDLSVRYVYMHDGEEGILAGNIPDGELLIEHSRFERLGAGPGFAHGIYINGMAHLIVRNSLFLRSREQGHELKSRALRTTIECSVLASLDGQDSYTLDLPNGGEAVVTNSVLQQGPPSPNKAIISWRERPTT